MNLWHKTAAETETHPLGQPWYVQPETIPETQTAETTQTPPVLSPPPTAVTPTHFEPEAAERILARAGLLQETHRQNLSKAQVEAIAAEIGIEAEFVRLAMEQEAAGVLPRQEMLLGTVQTEEAAVSGKQFFSRASVTAALYGIFAAVMLKLGFDRWEIVISLIFLLPAILALALGMTSRRRRWGATSGAALAMTAIAVVVCSFAPIRGFFEFTAENLRIFALMIGGGTLLGSTGAVLRRVVRRRIVKNRGRRTVKRTETP